MQSKLLFRIYKDVSRKQPASKQYKFVGHHGQRETTPADWRHGRADTDATNANANTLQGKGHVKSSGWKQVEAIPSKLGNQGNCQKAEEGIRRSEKRQRVTVGTR